MSHNTAMQATSRNSVPTTQCRVQKHAPEAKKINVAAMDHILRTISLDHAPVRALDVKGQFDSIRTEASKL